MIDLSNLIEVEKRLIEKPRPAKHKRVLVATPSLDGKVESAYAVALAESMLYAACHNIELVPVVLSKNSIIQLARNELVNFAIELNADGMLWIDSDTGWDKIWPVALIERGLDIVTAAVPRKEEMISFALKVVPDTPFKFNDGLLEIAGVGCAFVYWSRSVIDWLWNNSPMYITGEGERRWIFEVILDTVKHTPMGEDFLVCKRLREAGFKVWLDTRMSATHYGSKGYTSDVRNWLVEIMKEQRARELLRTNKLPDKA